MPLQCHWAVRSRAWGHDTALSTALSCPSRPLEEAPTRRGTGIVASGRVADVAPGPVSSGGRARQEQPENSHDPCSPTFVSEPAAGARGTTGDGGQKRLAVELR